MILEVGGISFDYHSSTVLKDVTFAAGCNELLAIMGPNGVGKTTLLKCINAIHRPSRGAIFMEGEDILALHRLEIARKMAYVPQFAEPARLTVFDAVLLGRRPHIRWGTSERDLQIVDAVLRKLGLDGLSLRYIDEMSGGELQKVSIARALVQEPKVLLLDEPTSSLDLRNQLEIIRLIGHIVRGHDMAAVMTMHDLNMALRYADRFIFMKDGAIFFAGLRDEITADTIESVYGVPVFIEHINGNPLVMPLD